MEEILSSIKRIIAEESATVAKATPRSSARARSKAKPVVEADEVDGDATESAENSDEILELTDAVEDEPMAAETILSDETAAASRSSLAALSALIVRPDDAPSNTLEGVVRDMLRPMLREWLDANLPELVEKMVAKEIARLTERQF